MLPGDAVGQRMIAASPLGAALGEDASAGERRLFDIFAAVAQRQPDHQAVDDGNTRLS